MNLDERVAKVGGRQPSALGAAIAVLASHSRLIEPREIVAVASFRAADGGRGVGHVHLPRVKAAHLSLAVPLHVGHQRGRSGAAIAFAKEIHGVCNGEVIGCRGRCLVETDQ